MKEKFTTVDLFAVVGEFNRSLLGMRVVNVYDIDQKHYLIKLAKPDMKVILMFESGCRIHVTEFEWPKNLQPSGFSMKMRKHLRARRLISITQLGVDRVLDLQFGCNEAAYHLILELYDRGNVILTDHSYTILSLLRTRTDADTDVRFAARQTFSTENIKREQPPPTLEIVHDILSSAKVGEQVKHALNPHFVYGSALLSHCLLGAGLKDTAKIGSGCDPVKDCPKVLAALQEADTLFRQLREKPGKGIIIQKRQVQPKVDGACEGDDGDILTNVEFHPMLFRQHETLPHKEVESFNKAVDEFFSSRSSQKQDLKALNLKKTAVKKLDYIRMDHLKRIDQLQKTQGEDAYKASLIQMNSDLVTKACIVIRSAVANAMNWGDIELLVKDAQGRGDPVALAIRSLKLKTNEITMLLHDEDSSNSEEEAEEVEEAEAKMMNKKDKVKMKGTKVDIDLGLSAYANATRFFGHKKHAAKKEQKTIDASEKALKSAQRKAKITLREASAVAKIQKARKVHWFEKFFWFISSENYLVIGGRDQQQNDLVVKKYLKEGDVYVHADIHGATSVVVKNPYGLGSPVPPKTLNEAGFMAVCYSSAWDAHIIISAWWVHHHQVSKTAPTGEYLTTGSFMIRGKKNFLPPCQLVLGFGFLFRVDDSCIPNHLHERRVKETEEDKISQSLCSTGISEQVDGEEEVEITVEDDDDKSEVSGEEVDGEGCVADAERSNDSEEAESAFPDTAITISHIEGDEFELQCSRTDSIGSGGGSSSIVDSTIPEVRGHHHLSAKQKRDFRKKRQCQQEGYGDTSKLTERTSTVDEKPQQKVMSTPIQQQNQPKRGKKFKQKKAKDKYRDQDEEERVLMMEFLASAGPQKEPKSSKNDKKKKKNFDTTQSSNSKLKYRQKEGGRTKDLSSLAKLTHKQLPPTIALVHEKMVRGEEEEVRGMGKKLEAVEEEDNVEEVHAVGVAGQDLKGNERLEPEQAGDRGEVSLSVGAGFADKDEGNHSGDDGEIVHDTLVVEDEVEELDEEEKKVLLEEESIQQLEREQMTGLDFLTGCPLPDDVLLYAIAMCGPYSSMLNYKFKVKLVPGTSRRGKAAKAALQRFAQSKETSQREKDLLKSVKDNDLSRYIPGKVKMSLPQSSKQWHSHR